MFVLINIPASDDRKNTFPLGLAYIAACYGKFGKVKVFDLHFHNAVDEMLDYFYENEIRFAGFSVCSSRESMSCSSFYAKMIKRISPNTIVGIGGPHPTYQGMDIIRNHLEFDVAFIGEGELSATQFAENIAAGKQDCYEGVNNICYRNSNGEVITAEYRKNDTYVLPARQLFPSCKEYTDKFKQTPPVICIETTRGCVGRCSFCALKLSQDGGFVKKDISLFEQDLEMTLCSQKLEQADLFIVDADFLISPERTKEVIDVIKRHNEIRFYSIACCADSILRCRDILDELFDSGCTYIEIGVESFSEEQLRRYHKRSSAEKNIQAIELLNKKREKYKFTYQLDMIMFEPFASLEDIRISNSCLQKYTYASSSNEHNFFHLMEMFPATRYRAMSENAGLSMPSSEMDIPFWKFKDGRVAELYRFVFLYDHKVFAYKRALEEKIEDRIRFSDKRDYSDIRNLRMLKTMTYEWFNDMLNADGSDCYPGIFETYYKRYKKIERGYQLEQ